MHAAVSNVVARAEEVEMFFAGEFFAATTRKVLAYAPQCSTGPTISPIEKPYKPDNEPWQYKPSTPY